MIWQLDLALLVFLAVTAIAALAVPDRLGMIAIFGAYSVILALLFVGLGAPDVAFVEAALGAGMTGLLFVAAVLKTSRASPRMESSGARWPAVIVVGLFLGVMIYASTDLPDRGDPAAEAQVHVASHYVDRAMEDSSTPNVVTATLADYRSQDTLGEVLVIFTAGLACLLILRRRTDEGET